MEALLRQRLLHPFGIKTDLGGQDMPVARTVFVVVKADPVLRHDAAHPRSVLPRCAVLIIPHHGAVGEGNRAGLSWFPETGPGDIPDQAFRRVFDILPVRLPALPGGAFKLVDDIFY